MAPRAVRCASFGRESPHPCRSLCALRGVCLSVCLSVAVCRWLVLSVVETMKLYRREWAFYRSVRQMVPVRVPRMFCSIENTQARSARPSPPSADLVHTRVAYKVSVLPNI